MQQAFLDYGLIVCNFDATNSFNRSGGEYEKSTLWKRYEDLEDIMSWLKEQDFYMKSIYISGHSMWWYAVAKYAQNFPDEIDFCLPIAPVVTGQLTFEAVERFSPWKLKEWEDLWHISHPSSSNPERIKIKPWSHMQERLNHTLLEKASFLTMPIFLYVWEDDEAIPPDHVQMLHDAIVHDDKHITIAPSVWHVYRTEAQNEHLYDSIIGWLKIL